MAHSRRVFWKTPFPGQIPTSCWRHVLRLLLCTHLTLTLLFIGWFRMATVREKSGKFDFSSRSGKSQGILQIGQGNFKYQETQGKVREFIIWAQNMCCSRYFDYLKCEKSVELFLSLAQSYENLLILEHSVARNLKFHLFNLYNMGGAF